MTGLNDLSGSLPAGFHEKLVKDPRCAEVVPLISGHLVQPIGCLGRLRRPPEFGGQGLGPAFFPDQEG